MSRDKLCMILFLSLVFFSQMPAQDINVEKHPGYINLEEIEIPSESERIIDISLGPAFLRFINDFLNDKSDKDSRILTGIISIRVKSFDIRLKDTDKIRSIMKQIEEKLGREKWERLVRVKDEDELIDVSMKFEEEKPVGLLLMALDPGDEAAFVNIIGKNIDMKTLGCIRMGLKDSFIDCLTRRLDWN